MKCALPFALCAAIVCVDARASDASDWKKLDKQGRDALEKNEFSQAENIYMRAAEAGEKLGQDNEHYSASLRGLGFAAVQMQDYANADFAYTRLVRADGTRLGTNDQAVAADLIQLTEVAGYSEQFLRGHESIDAATAIVEKRFGEYSPAMGFCLATRGDLEMQEQHNAEAETNFQKALDIFERKGTIMHFSGLQVKPSDLQLPPAYDARVLNNLALCQIQEKKFGDAEGSVIRAMKILEHEYGKNSVQLVTPLDNLGNAYANEKKFPEAEQAARRALSLLGKVDPAHPMVQTTRELLAKILSAEGKGAEAAKYAQ